MKYLFAVLLAYGIAKLFAKAVTAEIKGKPHSILEALLSK